MAPTEDATGPTGDLVAEAAPVALARGTAVGRYLLLDLVGQGGMGVVYRAYDPELDRPVALKLLHGGGVRSEQQRDRLLREAQALAKLQHPNVIAVYDAGTYGDDVFLTMEFVEGRTLRDWLKERARTPAEVLEVFLAAGEGLAAAHRAGLVHRDFKPDNVIVGADGRVRVLDFGLARPVDAARAAAPASAPPSPPPAERAPPTANAAEEQTREARRTPRRTERGTTLSDHATPASQPSANRLAIPLTHAGAIVGTPRFMAPEQHLGEATDERADQFSYCVSLYRALCDDHPFAGETADLALVHALRGEVLEHAALPRWLWPVLVRGLAARPADRYPSMAELLVALRADPRRARRRWLQVVGAVGVPLIALVAWRGVQRREVTLCAGAERKLVGVWDGARRASVRAAFDKTGLSYAGQAFTTVAQTFDGYARSWVAMHVDACEATQVRHEQSHELLDLRMSCLADRLTQLQTLAEALGSADAGMVGQAVQSVQSLPALERCADVAALRAPIAPPPDAQTGQHVEEVRRKLARLHALGLLRHGDDLLKETRAVLVEAQGLRYPPLEAEAQLRLGELLEDRGDFAEAAREIHRAWVAGLVGHHDFVIGWAATDLIRAIGVSQAHYDEGDRWADVADAVLGRLQHQDNLLGAMLANRAELRKEESRYGDAVRDGKRAIELLVRTIGPQHQGVAEAYNTLGNIYRDQQQFAAALDSYHRGMDIWLRLGGPDHPRTLACQTGLADVLGDSGEHDKAYAEYQRVLATLSRVDPDSPNLANIRNNLGTELMALGRPREAVLEYERALADWQKRVGPSTETVTALNNLGGAMLELDRLAESERYYQEAFDVSEKVLGPNHLYAGVVLQGLGDTRLRMGKREAALADYRRSLAIVEKSLDAKNPRLVASLLGMGRVELERHAPAAARGPLERALAIAEAQPGDGRELGEVRGALAQVRWAAGDQAHATQLATQARDGLARVGPRAHRRLAEVTTWLAQHR